MRNGLIGLASALALASLVTGACSSGGGSGSTGGTGGGGGSGGGTTGTGGTSSGGGAGGGGGTGGSGPSVTTLGGGRAVNALSPTEVTKLCDDTWAYFGTAIPKAMTCKWKGLSLAASSSSRTETEFRQGCAMAESTCQQVADPWANNSGCSEIPTTCTATVAQYSTCISDEVAALMQIVNGFPACASLMLSDSSAILTAQAADPPPSCLSLMNACPDLYPPNPIAAQ